MLNSKMKWAHSSRQKGAGLVETLVSLLILGVGLLGVLSLQANGTSSSQRAVFLTEAQVLAQDMADRLRAYGNDGFGARDGSYDGIDTDTAYSDQDCSSVACDADETLVYDSYQWKDAFENSSLPSGRGMVFAHGGGTATNTYTVRILWDQDRTGADQVPDAPDLTNQPCLEHATDKTESGHLTCYDVTVSLYRN